MNASLPKTAKELIEFVQETDHETPTVREGLVSSVRYVGFRIAGWRGIQADDPLAALHLSDIAALDHELVQMRAEANAIGDSTTKAHVSRFRKACKVASLQMPDGRGDLALTEDWCRIVEAAAKLDSLGIDVFAKWANNRHVEPNHVDDAVFTLFGEEYPQGRDEKSSKQTVRRSVSLWMQLAQEFGLQSVSHPIAYTERGWYVDDAAQFSEPVQNELSEFEERLVQDPPRDGRSISPKVAAQYAYILRQTLSAWCRAADVQPGSISSAVELCSVDRLTIALEFMIGRKEHGDAMVPKSTGAYQACRVVRDFARYLLPESDPFLVAVVDMVTALHTGKMVERDAEGKRRPSRSGAGQPKRLKRAKEDLLLSFVDQENAKRLLGMPTRHYVSLQKQPSVNREELTILADCCALEIMLSTNAWPSQLASLRVQDVNFESKGSNEICVVRLDDRDVFQLVGDHCVVVKAYLELVRPRRPAAAQPWLFPGRGDGPRPPNSLSNSIRALLADEFQLSIAPLDLQKIVVFVYALHAPDGQAVLEKFLGLKPGADHPMVNSWKANREALRIDRNRTESGSEPGEDA